MEGEGGGLVAWLKKKGCVYVVKGSGSEARASEAMADEAMGRPLHALAEGSEAMGERMGGEEVSKLADSVGRGESVGRSGSGAAVADVVVSSDVADVVVLGVGAHFLPAANGLVAGAAARKAADAGESEGEGDMTRLSPLTLSPEGEGDITRLGPRCLQVGAGPAHLRGA